jgi:hypothetical protein
MHIWYAPGTHVRITGREPSLASIVLRTGLPLFRRLCDTRDRRAEEFHSEGAARRA